MDRPTSEIHFDFKTHLEALLQISLEIYKDSQNTDDPTKATKTIDNLIRTTINEFASSVQYEVNQLNNFLDHATQFQVFSTKLLVVDKCWSNELKDTSVNELIDEPIKIPEIPVSEREHKVTIRQVEKVLSVLDDKYKIHLSLDGKELFDLFPLKLEEDLGLIPMDIKLFIPSMFMNKINSEGRDRVTFLYQEDYTFIERISTGGTFRDLVQLYAILDNRAKSLHWLDGKVLTKAIDPSTDS